MAREDLEPAFDALLVDVRSEFEQSDSARDRLTRICDLLRSRVEHYDWVGFYLVDPDRDRELVLGPFSGDDTEHTRIPFGQGICGQAADREEVFLVQDVSQESNYLSCSAHVKSEIVVPVFLRSHIVGEIDIDSHTLAPFTDADQQFLEQLAELIAPTLPTLDR